MTSRTGEPVPPRFFALRTPLLSFDEFLAWSEGSAATVPEGDAPLLEAALVEDRQRQRERLLALVTRPEIREALFLASPDLDTALAHWERDPESEKGLRAERALVKYLSRMSGRATPFGLFAGGSTGTPGEKTRLVLGPREASTRHSRLDMDYLFALSEAIGSDRALRRSLEFRPSSTLYRAGERLRYVESRVRGQERTYHLVAVEATAPLCATLDKAKGGARLEELAAALVDESVGLGEARAFVDELADSQILVPDTGMVITGPEPGPSMAERLARFEETAAIGHRLRDVNLALDDLDSGGLGASPDSYRALAGQLADLPARPEIARLVQVDLTKAVSRATLGAAVVAEIRRGIDFLHRVCQPWKSPLPAFREAFAERYEEREVPLVEALDEERGIGFPAYQDEDDAHAPLLAGVRFPGAPDDTVRWGAREKHLLKRLGRALSLGEDEIVLDGSDARVLENPDRRPLPGAFAAMARVMAPSEEALDRGDFRVFLESTGGPSGALFLGRFCHADPELRRLVEEHLKEEEALEPDALFAEVVHLPDGRTGNVLSRPLFHEYEIPYLGESGAPRQRQLPVTDLLVSVRGEEIRLRSKQLGKRVVPRLTTAHNFAQYGLGLYRFLCALQAQSTVAGLLWHWGPLAASPFLPRVRHGRTILAPAQWNVETAPLKKFGKRLDTTGFAALRTWRAAHRLPRFVMVGNNQEIPIDLESVLSLEVLLSFAKERETLELREMLPGPGDLVARGPEGRYVHEILVPFVGEAREAVRPLQPAPERARRSFLPGSEWLYAKLYGGNVSLDQALVQTLGPFATSAVASGAADSWFFVRYADPRPHLRLRLHGDPRRLREQLLPDLQHLVESLQASGQVWKMQLDTYEREMERYGGPTGMDFAERVFHADADAVLEILSMLESGEAGHEERWRMALVGVDVLLDDFGFSFDEKRGLVAEARKAFGLERREDSDLKRTLGETYRTEGRGLLPLLERSGLEENPLRPGLEVLSRRSLVVATAARDLRSAEADGRLARPVRAIAGALVHMFLNRVFLAGQRKQELVIYDLLERLYGAMAATGKTPPARPLRPGRVPYL